MSDTQKLVVELSKELGAVNISYTPFYLSAFNRAINSYDKHEGKVDIQSLSTQDLNSGVINSKTTDVLRTKSKYIQDGFYKFMMATKTNIGDYETTDFSELNAQILTKFEMFNDKQFLNGNSLNKGLFRSVADDTYIIDNAYTLPTTIASTLKMFGDAIKIINKSGNGQKRVMALGTVNDLLYSESSVGSGTLMIDFVKSKFPNLQFLPVEEIEGLPALNALLVYNADMGEVKVTGEGAKLNKVIDTDTGKDYIYENGSIGCYFTNINSACLFKMA